MTTIILPTASKYEGSVVSIYNNTWPPYTKSFRGTYVQTQNGQKIFVPKYYDGLASEADFLDKICVSTGVVQLVALMGSASNGTGSCIRWAVLK